METGKNIPAKRVAWVPRFEDYRLQNNENIFDNMMVVDLIDDSSRKLKEMLINATFSEQDANIILNIPLTKAPHEDFQAWKVEAFGDFSIRSVTNFCYNNQERLVYFTTR